MYSTAKEACIDLEGPFCLECLYIGKLEKIISLCGTYLSNPCHSATSHKHIKF
jgi:hypothetical protein